MSIVTGPDQWEVAVCRGGAGKSLLRSQERCKRDRGRRARLKRTAPHGADPQGKPLSAHCLGRHRLRTYMVPRGVEKPEYTAVLAALLAEAGGFGRINHERR